MKQEEPVEICDTYQMLVNNECKNPHTVSLIVEDDKKRIAKARWILGLLGGYGLGYAVCYLLWVY